MTPLFSLSLAPHLLHLMRWRRQAGTLLLFFPCTWGLFLGALAADAQPTHLPYFLSLFALGSLCLRSAGCIINDLWDRDLDRQVRRTASRPLAAGTVTTLQALVLLAGLCIVGLMVLLALPSRCWGVGLASMALVVIYPLMKRYTYWPQLFLGLTFNYGVILGFYVVMPTLSLSALILYVSGILWTLCYDTLYAHQDRADDQRVGIKSLAILWGDATPFWCRLAYFLQGLALGCVGWLSGLPLWYFIGIAGVTLGHIAWLWRWPPNYAQALTVHAASGAVISGLFGLCFWLR